MPCSRCRSCWVPLGVLPCAFSTRYMDMVRDCMRDETSLALFLSQRAKGRQQGSGSTRSWLPARITAWDINTGLLQIRTAAATFRFLPASRNHGLIMGEIDLIEADRSRTRRTSAGGELLTDYRDMKAQLARKRVW